mgnify:FL=1|jgi:hypothetical protein|tara:strand:- start:407 stop:529 length:123 start_codon:yes stop_codon:yes gene_type:complete
MKIDISVSIDTIEDKDIGTELLEVLIALKERIDQMNDEED